MAGDVLVDLRTEEKFTKKGCGTYSFLFKDMFHCFIHLFGNLVTYVKCYQGWSFDDRTSLS